MISEHTVDFFLLYSLAYAVSVILAGCYAIRCGHRLLLGEAREGETGEAELDVSSKSGRFLLRTKGTGVSLAVFGMVLIGAVLILGRPALVLERIDAAPAADAAGVASPMRLEIRGDSGAGDTLEELVASGVSLELKGDTRGAVERYEEALALLATAMNNRAWLYFEEGELEKALGLARLACALAPKNANYADTLARIETALHGANGASGTHGE